LVSNGGGFFDVDVDDALLGGIRLLRTNIELFFRSVASSSKKALLFKKQQQHKGSRSAMVIGLCSRCRQFCDERVCRARAPFLSRLRAGTQAVPTSHRNG
jgi:hypothetical protein